MFVKAATFLAPLLLLLPSVLARPLDTPEIYFLLNCATSNASYAEIGYFWDSSVAFDGIAPDETGTINVTSAVDYQGGTWTATDGFRFTAWINASADALAAGTLAGTANAATNALPLNCFRDSEEVIYVDDNGFSCESEYRCTDVS
jgi:hypothetical protein